MEAWIDHLLARCSPSNWSACWLWDKALNDKGYATATVGKKTWRAHRLAYTLAYGVIPKGLVVDHLCNVRRCINPLHLEAITQAENLARKIHLPKTHCPAKHAYTEANSYVYKGKVACRECHKRRTREWARGDRAKSRSDSS